LIKINVIRQQNEQQPGSWKLELWGDSPICKHDELILFRRMIEESAKVSSALRWMVLLGLPDNELPEPARLTTRSRLGEVMWRRPSLWPKSRIYEEHAIANTLKELRIEVGGLGSSKQKCFRNRLGRSASEARAALYHRLALRQVVCHVLLIFPRPVHTNTISNMEYPTLICFPASPSPCPLVLALPPSQLTPPQAHRPLRHTLLQLQSCKMNNS
jgi:hypothetical protein